jgi:hypothetical protein
MARTITHSELSSAHEQALATLMALVAICLVLTVIGLAVAGLTSEMVVLPAVMGGCTILFAIILLIVWWLSWREARRGRAFLASSRPVVRWTYSEAEWAAIREVAWEDERDDWRAQWGCLAALVALVGALTGAMIGLDESLLQGLGSGFLGLLAGGAVGAALGAAVGLSNRWAVRRAHRQLDPESVALAPGEVYALGSYFRGQGDRSAIEKAELLPGEPTTLRLEIRVPPRPRGPRVEEWLITVPADQIEDVEFALPLLYGRPE